MKNTSNVLFPVIPVYLPVPPVQRYSPVTRWASAAGRPVHANYAVSPCIRHDGVPLGREGEALAQIIQAWADEGCAVQEPTASVIEGHPVELSDEERVLGLQLNGLAHPRPAEAS